MKGYLQEAQMELFIFSIMTEFMTTEGYTLSEQQQRAVIDRSLSTLKALGYEQNIAVESGSIEDLKESIQKLAIFSMQLFSLCVMQGAREEKYKEIINSLKDKNND
jgi:hypothetical protein